MACSGIFKLQVFPAPAQAEGDELGDFVDLGRSPAYSQDFERKRPTPSTYTLKSVISLGRERAVLALRLLIPVLVDLKAPSPAPYTLNPTP